MAWESKTNFNSRSVNPFGLVAETFAIFFSRIPQFFHASLVPAGLLVLIYFAATPFLPEIKEGELIVPDDAGSILFLFAVMDYMILQAFAVAVIRAIFTGSASGVAGIAFSRREVRYAGLSIVLMLILFLYILVLMIMFVFYAALKGSGEEVSVSGGDALFVFGLALVGLIGYSVLAIRLAPSLPAAALDHPGGFFEIIGDSWESTGGTVIGASIGLFLLSLLQILTFWIFMIPIQILVFTTGSILLGYLLGTLYGMGFAAFFLSFMAAYHNRVGGWVSYDP